jgi:hypothetical protein
MTFIALGVGLGSAVIGGVMQNRAAKKGADAQERGNAQSTAEQRRQFDLTRSDQKPWMDAGTNALTQQNAFLAGDWSGFQNSPDYAFAVDQGFKGLNRGAAANGSFGSGGADADRIALGQGLATQYAGNYWSKLAGMSNTGGQVAQGLGQLGANVAQNIGNNYANTGQARASSYAAQGNAWNGALQGAVGAFGNYWGSRGR